MAGFWWDTRWRTTALLNVAAIMERADEQVLPAVYFFISRSLAATPSQLGMLTLCRALVQALCSPLSGLVGDRADRTKVIAVGCVIWGIFTSAIGLCTSLHQAMFACGFNGLGLALVMPCLQSLTADYNTAEHRGKAFGMMFFTGSLGGMLGGFMATNLGGLSLWHLDGWRLAFHVMAVVSLVTAGLILRFAVDPRPSRAIHSQLSGDSSDAEMIKRRQPQRTSSGDFRGSAPTAEQPQCDIWVALSAAAADVRCIMAIPTFRIILLQGIVGVAAWQAMVFFTLWLQLLGFGNLTAATLMAAFALGTAFGQILGGWIGDAMAQRFPDTGRILTAQASIAIGLPLGWLLLRVLPGAPGLPSAPAAAFGATLFVMGLTITWPGPINPAIMADICPVQLRSTLYSFDRSFEGGVGACTSPLAGIIAERLFGFDTGPVAADDATSDTGLQQHKNAEALSRSLLLCLMIPWVFCLLSFTGALCWYPDDKAAACCIGDKGCTYQMGPDWQGSEARAAAASVEMRNLDRQSVASSCESESDLQPFVQAFGLAAGP